MTARRLWQTINDLDEEELRVQVVIPVLRATPHVLSITDVHGQNERGLDIIFFTENEIETICYGLQLKRGNISGGGTSDKTVKQIVDQLELAESFAHPVATQNAGSFQIDRFIVATSGNISSTARAEIATRLKAIPVQFWDGHEIIRRIHRHLPQLFHVSDGATASYLTKITERFNALDTLDQIPGVAKRTLSEVFEEPRVERIFDPIAAGKLNASGEDSSVGAFAILSQEQNAVIIAEQDGGKTALFRMFAVKRAQGIIDGTVRGLPVPLMITAKAVLVSGFGVVDACRVELRRLGEMELAETVEDDLRVGNYFVCVDGFSELHLEEDKGRVASMVGDFAEQFDNTMIVVAARPTDFLTPRYFPSFTHYRTVDFDSMQTASLVRRWLGDSAKFEDVAHKMVERLREALQLPGSPIPATIGVMVHEQQGRYITNTAEAIERYMVIRLGRYANELGMKQEIDWARKQDLLAEVAFEMVENEQDVIDEGDFVSRIENIQVRQGDQPRGGVILEELVQSGVLSREQGCLSFFRTSFRDFFAAHHLHQRGDLENFAVQNLFDRRWGNVIVFAAGLRRKNSGLLSRISAEVARFRSNQIGERVSDDYFFGAYICGRTLANSESADHGPKVAALRTTLTGVRESIPELTEAAVEQFGNIGKIVGLVAADHSFFVAVGVPWLRMQLVDLLGDSSLLDEDRFLLASTYANLGYEDCFARIRSAVSDSSSTLVLIALQVLLWQLDDARTVTGDERKALEEVKSLVEKRLSKRRKEVKSLVEIRPQILRIEQERMRRLQNKRARESQ